MSTFGVTVARRNDAGWECVDDRGRRLVLAPDEIDPTLRTLRAGQRLLVHTDPEGRRLARLP